MESTKKSLKEATNTGYNLADLKKLLEIDKKADYYLGIMPTPKHDEIPFAWDAVLEVRDDGQIEIRGGFGAGGPEAGKVTIVIPLASLKTSFDLVCDYHELDKTDSLTSDEKDFVRTLCRSY